MILNELTYEESVAVSGGNVAYSIGYFCGTVYQNIVDFFKGIHDAM